jgi:hypothetical protein
LPCISCFVTKNPLLNFVQTFLIHPVLRHTHFTSADLQSVMLHRDYMKGLPMLKMLKIKNPCIMCTYLVIMK